jgi:hypothetical protein
LFTFGWEVVVVVGVVVVEVVVVEVVVVEVVVVKVVVNEVDDELEVKDRLAVDVSSDELSIKVVSGIFVSVIEVGSDGCVFNRVVTSKISSVVSARLWSVIAEEFFETIGPTSGKKQETYAHFLNKVALFLVSLPVHDW